MHIHTYAYTHIHRNIRAADAEATQREWSELDMQITALQEQISIQNVTVHARLHEVHYAQTAAETARVRMEKINVERNAATLDARMKTLNAQELARADNVSQPVMWHMFLKSHTCMRLMTGTETMVQYIQLRSRYCL